MRSVLTGCLLATETVSANWIAVERFKMSQIMLISIHILTKQNSYHDRKINITVSNTHFLSPTDQKCADSSRYWQFFHYRPPGKLRSNERDREKNIMQELDIYIYRLILLIIDRFSILIGNTENSYIKNIFDHNINLSWVTHCENIF